MFAGYVEDVSNVARDGGASRNLDLRIEHLEYFVQLCIFDNGEWPVTTSDPNRQQITEASLAVRRSLGERLDALLGQYRRRVACCNMAQEVSS